MTCYCYGVNIVVVMVTDQEAIFPCEAIGEVTTEELEGLYRL